MQNNEKIPYYINQAILDVKDSIDENELDNIKKSHNLNDNWLEHFVEENIIKLITDRNDLHIGNVLLKKTTRKTIDYKDFGQLETFNYIPILIDYDRSIIKKSNTYSIKHIRISN